MGKFGGPLNVSGGAASVSRQIRAYAASGARATATRAANQEAERAFDAARYLKAARAGQITVFAREPTPGTAAYEAKRQILAAEKQAATEKRAADAKAAEAKRIADAKAAEEKRAAGEKQSLTQKALSLISLYGKKLALLRFPWIKNFIVEDSVAENADVTLPEYDTCKEGMFYDAAWYVPCKEGYVEYSLKGHNKCICSARLGDAKLALDTLYATKSENGEKKGITDILGALSKGEININSIILAAAVVMLIISLIKR